MPSKKANTKLFSNVYMLYLTSYIILFLLEIIYLFLAWSPYGHPDGKLKPFYMYVKKHLTKFVVFSIIILFIFGMFYPGLGVFALIVTLYRVSEMCCGVKETFGDGLPYGWGTYHPDHETYLDQGLLERDEDQTKTGYSSAVGDVEDKYLMADVVNKDNKKLFAVYSKGNNGYGNWIVPKLKYINSNKNRIDDYCGSSKCDLSLAGEVWENYAKPRPLYTTSLMAKELNLS